MIQTKIHGVQACHGSSSGRSMRHGMVDGAGGAVACLGRGLSRGWWVVTGPRDEGGGGRKKGGWLGRLGKRLGFGPWPYYK
jgi:hypothetical protein